MHQSPVAALIAIGTLLRLALALARTDTVWPDEHFQTLEPAFHAIYGFGTLSWEWKEPYRSWFLPGLYLPLFGIAKVLGITGGMKLILAARVFTALVSGTVLWTFSEVLKRLDFTDRSRLLAVAILALSPSLVLWAPTTLGDNWALAMLWAALAFLLGTRPALGGALLGAAFLVKYQSALWGLGALAVFLGRKPSRKSVAHVIASGVGMVLFGGLLDWITWKKPWGSLLGQLSKGASTATFYGVSPWYDYIPRLIEDQGGFLVGSAIGAVVWNLRSRLAARRLWIAPPSAALVVGLSAIAHKETRFLLPALPLLPALAATFVDALPRIHIPRPARIGIWGLMLLATAFSLHFAIQRPLYLSSVNIADLETGIYADRGLKADGTDCILIVDHNWSWSRGKLATGNKSEILDKKWDEITLDEWEKCKYAIIPTEQASMLASHWKSLGKRQNRWTLFKNDLAR